MGMTITNPPTHLRYLSVPEVAARYRVHTTTVRYWITTGRLKATKLGLRYRVAEADLDAFAVRLNTVPFSVDKAE